MPGKFSYLAGHPEVALLNDALLRRLFRAGSGRIAQLVEQMTLNHRVPGSSPGAPTKLFKDLEDFTVLEEPVKTVFQTVILNMMLSIM